jgi:hypothetical protein
MTTKQLSEYFDLSSKSIQNYARELKIEMIKGKRKIWTKEEVNQLSDLIIKKKESTKYEDSRIDKLESIVFSLAEIVKLQIEQTQKYITQPKQIEIKQDYFSLLGYMRYKNIDEARFSEMIVYGKEASKISRELGLEIRKIPDERFGQVNSYHISVLERLFEI